MPRTLEAPAAPADKATFRISAPDRDGNSFIVPSAPDDGADAPPDEGGRFAREGA